MWDECRICHPLFAPMSLVYNESCTLMSNMNRISPQISQTSLQLLINTLLFENSSYSDKTNTYILNATIDYIQLAKRFGETLFWIMCFFSFFNYIFDKFTNLYCYKFQHNFFRLRLNFILFFLNYNCKIIVSYLLIASFSFTYLLGDDLWISRKETIIPWYFLHELLCDCIFFSWLVFM